MFFGNIAELVENKDCISEKNEHGKWRSMEYRTKHGQGKLLMAAEEVYPEPVTLNLNMTGWYKIYIGLLNLCSEDCVFIKLSKDEEYTPVRYISGGSPHNWVGYEYMEEVFWKCADLTDQQIIFAKLERSVDKISAVAWLRCE